MIGRWGGARGRAAALAVIALLGGGARAAEQGERWEPEIRRFEALDRLSPPPKDGILFVGSSTIARWDLARSFPGLPAINRGFGGSRISDCVRYAPRIVLPHAPRAIVFYAGDNDIASGISPEGVFEDFRRFVRAVRDGLPEARILFIAIKPSIARWHLIGRARDANARIRRLAEDDPRIEYIDIEASLLGPDGLPRRELFVEDGLHLNEKGYEVLTGLVRPRIDPRPPCTGGSSSPSATGRGRSSGSGRRTPASPRRRATSRIRTHRRRRRPTAGASNLDSSPLDSRSHASSPQFRPLPASSRRIWLAE